MRSFLATYTNITIVEREFSDELIELAKRVVADRKDRPIFVYTLMLRKEKSSTYLVTGDKALRDALNKIEENSAITIDGALKLIRGIGTQKCRKQPKRHYFSLFSKFESQYQILRENSSRILRNNNHHPTIRR